MQNDFIEGFNLSAQQKHVWSLQKMQTKQIYHTWCNIRIDGHLQIDMLQVALQKVVSRFEILRTSFKHLPGIVFPLQVISDRSIALEHPIDLSILSLQEQAEMVDQLLYEKIQMSLSSEQDQSFHVYLLKLSAKEHLMILALHALLADLVTLNNLVKQISQAYIECLGSEEQTNEVMQYVDFSEWQNDLFASEETKNEKRYWYSQGAVLSLEQKLPYEQSFSHPLEFNPQKIVTSINKDLTKEIELFVQSHQVSFSVLFLTCWVVLLNLLTGQRDVLTGVGHNGRSYSEVEEALGLFAKYLPLQPCIKDDMCFIEVLKSIAISVDENNRWQDFFSWEDIEGNHKAKFFPASFDFNNQLPIRVLLEDISFSMIDSNVCIDCFKLKLSCSIRDNIPVTELHYDPNYFQDEHIRWLLEHFSVLMKNAIEEPNLEISHLKVLSPSMKKKILVDFNSTGTSAPEDICIHQLFEKQVEVTPNEVAVVCGREQLTYTELNSQSNQLAHYLQKMGVGPDILVGICVDRSLDMIVAILGVLKAGGAYVPLDPTYPQDRLTMMLEDSRISFLLTQTHLKEHLQPLQQQLLLLDIDSNFFNLESNQNLTSEMDTRNIAYLIYTSGSTGKPNGVMVTHSNLVGSTIARGEFYEEPMKRFFLLSSFAFDSSVVGIFWTLCQGGRLVIPEKSFQYASSQIINAIVENKITHLLCTPSLYNHVVYQEDFSSVADLSVIIVAGEICPKELVELHYKKLPLTVLYNEYGPTEGTVWSTVYKTQRKDASIQIPIGRSISNMQIYILKEDLQPVPIGIPGELYIAGSGITRGYFNNPTLTSERFIPNPFSDDGGTRMYKTGDVCRYLPNGNLEFLGRTDQQVKIRGFRIELGEIETCLGELPAVRQTVVIANESNSDDKRLIAYVVFEQGKNLTSQQLRQNLQICLPDYMIPATFVIMEELPLTPNGKIDRQNLPSPEDYQLAVAENYEFPLTPTEKTIAEIWVEVLDKKHINAHSDFFEMGGHSLVATKVIMKVKHLFLVEFSLTALFKNPTLRDFAAAVDELVQTKDSVKDDLMGFEDGVL